MEYDGEYLFYNKYNGKGYDTNANIIYELKNGTGKVKEYYSNGTLEFEGEYLNGLKNAKGKEDNFLNGKLEYEGEYLNGKRLSEKKFEIIIIWLIVIFKNCNKLFLKI